MFRRRIPPHVTASPDLVRELHDLGARLKRRLGLLIDRQGSVTHVFLGDHHTIEIPNLDAVRRAPGRLRGLRWLCTSLKDAHDPPQRDLNSLLRHRLDLLLWIAPADERGPVLREVAPAPATEDGDLGYSLGPLHYPDSLRDDLLVYLQELEAIFERATPRAQATRKGPTDRAILAVVTQSRGRSDRLQRVEARKQLSEQRDELRELARAAGLDIRAEVTQHRSSADPHTLLGRGKLADLASQALTHDAGVVVFNADLAPRQQVALEDALELRVLDRTQLILDLFAQRARTHAGKLQVEVAQLRYALPRLIGRGGDLSRVGGGKGAGFGRTKGAGEKKLEIDRRRIRERIQHLERQLKQLKRQRGQRRQRRQRNRLPHVALVGYTNVGKSTLFNRLTDSEVVAADMPFASLDPTVRQRVLPGGVRTIVSDSVGFIRHLPKDLVEAFGATLDELEDATLLLHVADASDPHVFERIEAVRALLDALGHQGCPERLVFNKRDRLEDPELFLPLARTASGGDEPLLICARDGDLTPLLDDLEQRLSAPEDTP